MAGSIATTSQPRRLLRPRLLPDTDRWTRHAQPLAPRTALSRRGQARKRWPLPGGGQGPKKEKEPGQEGARETTLAGSYYRRWPRRVSKLSTLAACCAV